MRPSLILSWAARDVLRRPGEALLAAAALACFVWIVGTALLLSEAVQRTAVSLVNAGPSLVVRRLGPNGFAPMPEAATASVAAVPGALNVRPRVWGPVRANALAVELVALDETSKAALREAGHPIPGPEEAVAGPALSDRVGAYLLLTGPGATTSAQVIGALPAAAGLAAQDSLLVQPALARELLALPEGHATDLAVDVYRPSEEDAIRADLAAALPFPVALTTKTEARGRYAVSLARRGGLFLVLLVPAAFAVLALVAGVARDRAARGREIGLLKSLGWTTADIVRMHGYRATWVALPAVTLGGALAWLSVFGPWVTWPGALFFGWTTAPPALFLDAAGAGLVLVEVAVTVLVPWFAASLIPAIVGGVKDPWELISEESA